VAGADTSLVSMECVVQTECCGRSLSKQECFSLGATLSIYYDSLIEKCSTLSVVQAPADP
jgi:hypothetical protein